MPRLMWFDPGETTGVVDLRVSSAWLDGKAPADFENLGKHTALLFVGQLGRHPKFRQGTPDRRVDMAPDDENGMIESLWLLLRTRPRGVPWGCESFKAKGSPGGLSADALSPVRVQAALTALELNYGHGMSPFTQPVSLATTTVEDENLKAAGLHTPGAKDANMAARHALTFLRRARANTELAKTAWALVRHVLEDDR